MEPDEKKDGKEKKKEETPDWERKVDLIEKHGAGGYRTLLD